MVLRQSEYLAAIHKTAMLVKEALGLTLDYEGHLKKISEIAFREISGPNLAERAYRSIISLASSQKDSFWEKNTTKKQPPYGWLGVRNPNGRKDLIAFLPHQLEKFLEEKQFKPDPIIRRLAKSGLLLPEAEGNLTRKVTIKEERERMYVFKKEGSFSEKKSEDRFPTKRRDGFFKNRRIFQLRRKQSPLCEE